MNTSTIVLIASITALFSAMAAIISAIAAIASAVIGPIVTSRIATRQIRAGTASAGRQRWIEMFRDCLSAYSAKLFLINLDVPGRYIHLDKDKQKFLEEYEELLDRILLLLNVHDEDHRKLIKIITDVLGNYILFQNDEDKLKELFTINMKDVTLIGQRIIQKEWDLIKAGK